MVQQENNNSFKKRILAVPIMAVGHVNATIGLLKPLLKRGHRVAFLIDTTYQGKIETFGFEEFVFEPLVPQKTENPGDALAQVLVDNDILGQRNLLKQMQNMVEMMHNSDVGVQSTKRWNAELKKAIQKFQPDLFVIDSSILLPAIYYSNKPWINSVSAVPLFYLNDIEELPPACTGFTLDSDRKEWMPFKKIMKEFFYNTHFNDLLEEMGYDRYPNESVDPETQSLTVYAWPDEFSYPQIRQIKKDWFNIEVYNKNENHETVEFENLIPKHIFEDDLDGKFSGKWIYVSMGSMGSANLDLMHRLIQALAKTNHKYIVSKGPKHQEYELERNMWGDRYLPQTKILPKVDLVITHGGNNSVTETFAQGKPMIILPLFGDQLDNAQRLHDTKFGIRLDPNSFTEQQLQESIEQLLKDEDLRLRLVKARQRIQSSDKHEQFADLAEDILKKHDKSSEN